MSTDRELLELAAKAAGYTFEWGATPLILAVPPDNGRPWRFWHPIQCHRQAKQLRHVLQLTTGFDDRFAELGPCAYATYPTGPNSCDSIMQNIEQAGGKKAALRRAARSCVPPLKSERLCHEQR